MKFIANLIAVIFAFALFGAPDLAFAAPTSPQARAVVATIERQAARDALFGIAQQEYQAKLLDDAATKSAVDLLKAVDAAIEAKDYVTADERLADLAQLLYDNSEPKTKV